MIPLFLSFAGGYILGWVIRRVLAHFRPSLASCNIDKRGIRGRYLLSIILVMIGFYFEIAVIVFFAGFTWYESQAKWCIKQAIIQ